VSNEADSFVHEVDEKLREERMMALAKRYGPWLIGLFALFIVGLGGWQGWRAYTTGQSREAAESYQAAQDLARAGDLEGAKTAFHELTREGPRIYRFMAQMEHAALVAEEGDLEAALAEFDAAAEAAQDPTMRESAQIRAAYIAADTQDFEALQQRLAPLVEGDTRISYLARELLAVEAWEAGQMDLARTTFENLTLALDTPAAVRQRAQDALSVIGPAPEAASPPASEGETQ
jgi:hypothetical protein